MTSSMQDPNAPTGVNGGPRHGDQLQGAATGLFNQAARTADAQASTTMTRVGQTLDSVAQAINDASSGLRESQPELADFVGTAAEQVTGAAAYLRDHTASEALENVQHVARRQPALMIGGGLVAGLLIGRFLRTGASVAQSDMKAVGPYGGEGTGAYPTGGGFRSTDAAADYGSTAYGGQTYGATALGGTDVSTLGPADELAATDAAVDDALVIEVDRDAELDDPSMAEGSTRTSSKGR